MEKIFVLRRKKFGRIDSWTESYLINFVLKICLKNEFRRHKDFNRIRADLVIRGKFVFCTANTELADIKAHFDWKFRMLYQFFLYANK
jgi:hypothetical protein